MYQFYLATSPSSASDLPNTIYIFYIICELFHKTSLAVHTQRIVGRVTNNVKLYCDQNTIIQNLISKDNIMSLVFKLVINFDCSTCDI